jgi:uncharacterized protein (DUF2062 family)
MAKKFIEKTLQKVVPDHNKIKQHKNLQFLGDRLHSPNLWHINRRSISAAFAIGLFFAWVPTPTQMAFAAAAAVYFEANLLISVVLVWITNPLTMPPLYYFAYRVGLWFLGGDATVETSEFSVERLWNGFGDIIGPFLFGCLILGVVCSVAGYIGMNTFWRYYVRKKWAHRSLERQDRTNHQ